MTGDLRGVHVEERSGTLVARLTGEIDESNAPTIGRMLRERVLGRRLVVDLSDTRYLDSAGIAMLESLRKAADLGLVVAPGSIVGRALTVTGFDLLVPMAGSVDELTTAYPAAADD